MRQQRATIYECKTDSVLYKPLKRRRNNVLHELTFRKLSTLRDEFELSNGARRLNEFSALPPVPSDDNPFRVLQSHEKICSSANTSCPHECTR